MDYIAGNKEAWEEAFENRDEAWGADIVDKIKNERFPFFEPCMVKAFGKFELEGKTVAQFCSNNGRELLSLCAAGAKAGFGFDLAENQVRFANDTARELGLPCSFVAANILELGNEWNGRFDVAIITIGALCWFKDLTSFFAVIARTLREGGVLLVNEQHPVANMLGAPGEDNYLSEYPLNICNSYFEKEWIENEGMYYIAKKSYESKTFTNYTHSLSEIVGSACANGLCVTDFKEFDYDISGMFEGLQGKGVPLSYLLEMGK